MKPPTFRSQKQADKWLRQQELLTEWTTGRRSLFLCEQQMGPSGQRRVGLKTVGWFGIVVSYNTTATVTGGFIVVTYVVGSSGTPERILYVRRFTRRKHAKAAMLEQYGKYSPMWLARQEKRREASQRPA